MYSTAWTQMDYQMITTSWKYTKVSTVTILLHNFDFYKISEDAFFFKFYAY